MNKDSPSPGITPSAAGIIGCLRMLAREAAELELAETISAIERAMAACQQEAASAGLVPDPRPLH